MAQCEHRRDCIATKQSRCSCSRTTEHTQRHGVWRQLLADSTEAARGATTRAAAAAGSSQQQQQQQKEQQQQTRTATVSSSTTSSSPPAASSAHSTPEPRSGHAMTLLRPSGSVLLFGGSDGKIFYNDFHVLEPAQYAALGATQESSGSEISLEMSAVGEIAGLSQSSMGSCDDEHVSQTTTTASGRDDHANETENEHRDDGDDDDSSDDASELSLQWKQLVVTYSPAHYAAAAAAAAAAANLQTDASVPSSLDSDDSRCSSSDAANELPYVGGGRDYHSMHYIPTSRDDEAQCGMRVLVLGNILVATEDDAKRFEIDEFRIEEVRVRQPMLEAQWISQRISSLWKPRARQAHSSVLLGEHLYCFGGKNAATTAFYNDIFYFDVRRNEWVNPAPTGSFPAPRSYAGMAASRDKIYMYGGYDGRQQFGGIYVYDVRLSRWDKLAAAGDKPTARMNHSLTYLPPHHLIMFGGREHSSRQNDLSLFDIPTATWKQLSPDSNARAGRTRSAATASSSATGSSSSALPIVAATTPMGRTAHAAVHYDLLSRAARSRMPPPPEGERILIFGGYGGSLKWLDDLQLLTIPRHVLTPDAPPADRHLLTSALRTKDEKVRSQSAPAQCSQYSQQSSRGGSSSDAPLSVLSDITNQTPGLAPPASSVSDARGSSLSQTRERKKRKRQGESQDAPPSSGELLLSTTSVAAAASSSSSSSSSSQVGTQTAIIQLLQRSERLERGLALLAQEQTLHRHDHVARAELTKQIERLEQQLGAADQKIDALEKKLQVSEAEKHVAREQLVAADAELFVYRQSQASAPALKQELLDAIQQSNQYQFAASNLLENKLAIIHDTLEEIRHFSGERTETDDSPQKKDSMFPDDESKSQTSQPHLYPERVVINLEERLRSALAANEELAEKLRATEAKLKRAEGTSERIRQLSLAWLHESD